LTAQDNLPTVSDERLKTYIEDVDCNFTDGVKHVNVKNLEYTNEIIKIMINTDLSLSNDQSIYQKMFNYFVKKKG